MEKNKKLTILIILIIVGIIVWMPKGKRKQKISLERAPVSLEKPVAEITPAQRKKSEFTDWGRNPFVWPKGVASPVSDLTLSGIIWDEKAPYALINGSIVHTGDEIAGKTVKRIEQDKVILTDGSADYVLELK